MGSFIPFATWYRQLKIRCLSILRGYAGKRPVPPHTGFSSIDMRGEIA
jgi:hypothetical protein